MLLNKKSSIISVGGMLTALSVVCLFLTSVFQFSKIAFSFISSVIIGILYIAYGFKVASVHYIAVSVLSLLFVPSKTVAIIYVMIAGNYPIIKFLIDRCKSKYIKLLIKFFVFNIYILLCYLISTLVVSFEITSKVPLWALWIMLVMGLYLYDFIYMPCLKNAYSLLNKR